MKSWIKFRNWFIALLGFELFLLVFVGFMLDNSYLNKSYFSS